VHLACQKLCDQTEATDAYVSSLESAITALQSAVIDGMRQYKEQASQAELLQIRVDGLLTQVQMETMSTQHVQDKCTEQLEELRKRLTRAHEREVHALQQSHSDEQADLHQQHHLELMRVKERFAVEAEEKEQAMENALRELENEHQQQLDAWTSMQRSEATKHRRELQQSFMKLQRTTDLNLSLSDCLGHLSTQLADAGTSLEQLVEETAEEFLQLEDSFALERDVMQRKLELLSYCLDQLEQQWSGGSKMFEKLMAVCSNLEITRPGGATSPQCKSACVQCADDYLYMLNLSLEEHLKSHEEPTSSADISADMSSFGHAGAQSGGRPASSALPGTEDFTMQRGALAVGSIVPQAHTSPKKGFFSLAWWKDDTPRPNQIAPVPTFAARHVPAGDGTPHFPTDRHLQTEALVDKEPSAQDFSDKLATLCVEKLEAKLGGCGVFPAGAPQKRDSRQDDGKVKRLVALANEMSDVSVALQVSLSFCAPSASIASEASDIALHLCVVAPFPIFTSYSTNSLRCPRP
jgi:hypothetical protein